MLLLSVLFLVFLLIYHYLVPFPLLLLMHLLFFLLLYLPLPFSKVS